MAIIPVICNTRAPAQSANTLYKVKKTNKNKQGLIVNYFYLHIY
jgi:hypothetical protein